jgi:hypothetical protein
MLKGRRGDVVALLSFNSSNTKTGDMAQLWILPADDAPEDCREAGTEADVCGDCPLISRCYVNKRRGPRQVWHAWNDGRDYPTCQADELAVYLRWRSIRLGAWGDPAALPVDVVRRAVLMARGWTGYSHAWRDLHGARGNAWRQLVMASVETEAAAEEAQSRGWRTFRIVAPGDKNTSQERSCPHYASGIQCRDCLACRGSSASRSITTPAHGSPPVMNAWRTHWKEAIK